MTNGAVAAFGQKEEVLQGAEAERGAGHQGPATSATSNRLAPASSPSKTNLSPALTKLPLGVALRAKCLANWFFLSIRK
jgi:hypothetical protein